MHGIAVLQAAKSDDEKTLITIILTLTRSNFNRLEIFYIQMMEEKKKGAVQ